MVHKVVHEETVHDSKFKVEKLQSSEKQNISILDFLVYYFPTTFFIYLVVVVMWKEKDKDIEIDTHIM